MTAPIFSTWLGEVGGDRLRVEQVERPLLEADQLGGVLGHVEPVDLVDLGPARVVLVEGLEDDLLPRGVALEVEGAGADRVPLVLLAVLLDRLLRDDVALLVAHHAQQEDRVEGLQHDLHGVRVDDLDGLDHLEVHAEARARRPLDLPLEAELDVLGGQLAEALVELHALPELERPHRAVRRERPALGQVRLDLGGGDLAVLDREAREPPVHEALDGLGLPEDARVRIEGVGLLGRDVQDLLSGPGPRAARARATRPKVRSTARTVTDRSANRERRRLGMGVPLAWSRCKAGAEIAARPGGAAIVDLERAGTGSVIKRPPADR